MGFLLKILKTAIETSEILGMDATLRPAWQDRIEHISEFPVRMYVNSASVEELKTGSERCQGCMKLVGGASHRPTV